MMTVMNHTKNAVLADQAEIASTWFGRLRGLMFRAGLPDRNCLVIIPCNAIHTCFMKFNIDVLFADETGTVVYLLENMPPFRFSPIVRGAKYVVELPAHTVAHTGTSLRDRISGLGEIIKGG